MQEQIFKHRETQLLTAKEMKQDREAIIRAGQIIRQGGLVALPTEISLWSGCQCPES